MNNLPLVSVIIPTCKRPYFLKEAVNSVLAQTYPNIEIIIVDDDPQSNILHTLAILKNPKIRYFKNDKNRGASYCRNFGLKKAKGEYVAFLDDDDVWLPEKTEIQVRKFESLPEDYGIVYCGYNRIVKNKIVSRKNSYNVRGDYQKVALSHCPWGSPTPLIKRKFIDQINGFDESFPSCQDWDFWIQLSFVCKCDYVNKELALYRIHGSQISTDIDKKIKGREMILRKYYNHLIKYPKILSWHYRRLGSLYALINNSLKSREYFKLSLKYNKKNYGSYIHLILQAISKKLHISMIKKYGIVKIDDFEMIN